MFRRFASPMDTYAKVSDMAEKIQAMVEQGSNIIERDKEIKTEMMENSSIRSLKKQIDSDLYDIYEMAKNLEKKCNLIQRSMKG
jgi:hypothetical protein